MFNQNLTSVYPFQPAPQAGVIGQNVAAAAAVPQQNSVWGSNEQQASFPPQASSSTNGNGRYYNIWAVQNSATMEDNTENDQVKFVKSCSFFFKENYLFLLFFIFVF